MILIEYNSQYCKKLKLTIFAIANNLETDIFTHEELRSQILLQLKTLQMTLSLHKQITCLTPSQPFINIVNKNSPIFY